MKRRWIALPFLLALVGVGALLLLVSLRNGGGTGVPAAVPDVVGQRLDVAGDRLDYAGLDTEIAGGGTFGVIARSRWWVCDQEPAAGATATSVLLVVDRECEPRPIRAPDVEDLALDAAKRRLAAAELEYTVVSLEPERDPLIDAEWFVCDQEPPPGVATTAVELSVALTCEEPPPAPTGTVPDVRDQRLDVARTTLERAQISIDVYTPTGDEPARAASWTVCDQWSVPEHGYVQLFVSRDACWRDWWTP